MAKKELKDALCLIDKVLSDPRVESDQRDQLLRVRRELVKLARCGKVDRHEVFRVVDKLARLLLEVVAQEVTRRPE
jgi:hypothetical protein